MGGQVLSTGKLLMLPLAIWVILSAGCGVWKAPTGKFPELTSPPPARSPGTITLDVKTVDLPREQGEENERLWENIDEQVLPTEVRNLLSKNGFLAGVCSVDLDQWAMDSANGKLAEKASLDELELLAEGRPRSAPQRLQNRSGKRSKILVGEPRERLVVLLPESERIRGETFENAQCVMSLRAYPAGRGKATIELTPEIEFGDVRQRIAGHAEEGSFRFDSSKDRRIFEPLRFTVPLLAGQTLVVTSTPQSVGLGGRFFGGLEAKEKNGTRALLIRLAESSRDDLHLDETNREPLTTPLE